MGLGLEEQAVFYRQISLVFVSTIFVADLDAEALGLVWAVQIVLFEQFTDAMAIRRFNTAYQIILCSFKFIRFG